MLNRKWLVALIFLVAASAHAQEITRIALLDYNAVLNKFPRQSRELQRVQQLKTEVQEKIDALKDELTELQRDYEQEENKIKKQRIQNKIEEQKKFGRKYIESKNEEIKILQNRASRYSSSEELQKFLPDIIAEVAREQGYSMVLNKNSQSIIWFEISIDITEVIIQRLQDRMN